MSDRTAGSCLALARAVGAWAQIVLDDEVLREHEESERRERAETHDHRAARPPPVAPPVAPPADGDDGDDGQRPATEPRREVDVGTMLFLRNGAAETGGMFGVAPFATVAFAQRWVVRPSVMYGASTSRVAPDRSGGEDLSLLGGRLDLCRRIPGNYIDRRGIELDACVGADAAHVWSSRVAVARGSLGPSAAFRGELGHGLALEIRSMLGVSLNRRGIEGAALPAFVAAAELGASVRFR